MKAYKRWEHDEGRCAIPQKICEQVKDCEVCLFLQSRGWRGVLMWVKKMFKTNTATMFPPYDVSKEISNELES